MKVRRDIASLPQRSAKATWDAIVDLVTGSDTVDRDQLRAAASAMGDVITEENPAAHPIVFSGSGPQLRLYLEYYDKAVSRGNVIDGLHWTPTKSEDWSVQVPAIKDDLKWLNAMFAASAPRFKAYDIAVGFTAEETEKSGQVAALDIDWSKVNAS
ncbi:hypothetical protein [Hyphomonas sp. KY3]|uniref:hypothetical protein n=1 Tax=Hyphomonas sp. KY3 TaxID=2016196 RepID=UPI001A8FC2C9|nr:hypothetical protein [Hyphomonas sp. KY3]QSR22031.1 hypothetical protein CFA77_06950 [Hyphomonas sp. KY3]|tara:strand:- start:5886 stop:6353 length:468 start_codon:yes stop_codon:yes gene_type:complete